MKMHDSEDYLENYEGHVTVMTESESRGAFKSTTVTYNQKRFNAKGWWVTRNGIERWARNHLSAAGKMRFATWLDVTSHYEKQKEADKLASLLLAREDENEG